MWPRSEYYGSVGKADLVLVIPGKKYVIIEIKYVSDETENAKGVVRKLTILEIQKKVEKALQGALVQIEKKSYYKKYESEAKEIIKIGLVVYGRHEVKALFSEQI